MLVCDNLFCVLLKIKIKIINKNERKKLIKEGNEIELKKIIIKKINEKRKNGGEKKKGEVCSAS